MKNKNRGKWESLLVCLSCSLPFTLAPSKVTNRHDENWFPGGLFCVHPPFFPQRPVWLSLSPLHPPPPENTCFNCPFQYSTLFPWLFHLKPRELATVHYLSIRQLMCWSIRWRAMWGEEQSQNQIISLSKPQQQSLSFHLQIIALLILLQILSLWVNANMNLVSFFRGKTATSKKKPILFSSVNLVLSLYYQCLFSQVLISFVGVIRFCFFLLYRAKAEAKRLQCALSTTEKGVFDESTLLTWGYGTKQR